MYINTSFTCYLHTIYSYHISSDDTYVYFYDSDLSILAWGCGQGAKRSWINDNTNIVIPDGVLVNVPTFFGIATDPANNINMNNVLNANLPGITQGTLDNWLNLNGGMGRGGGHGGRGPPGRGRAAGRGRGRGGPTGRGGGRTTGRGRGRGQGRGIGRGIGRLRGGKD